MRIRLLIFLVLVGIVAVSSLPKRGKGGKRGGGGKGGGSRRPCGRRSNIASCTCEDGESYEKSDIKDNCKRDENPIESCTCVDETTWTKPEDSFTPEEFKQGKGRGKGRGRGRGKGKGKGKWKPCGDEDNLTQCTCQDEESYTSYADLKENCRKENPLVTCTCEDGDEWTPPKKPASKRKPCGDEENLEECTCLDEATYSSYDDLKANCKRKDNPVQFCSCVDGETWTSPGAKRKPCGYELNLEECTCLDEETYTSYDDLKENCKKRDNPIQSCTCEDGDDWAPPASKRPCGKTRLVESCTCEDGETYDNKRDIKRNCKKDENPITECQCENGTTWSPPSDEDDE